MLSEEFFSVIARSKALHLSCKRMVRGKATKQSYDPGERRASLGGFDKLTMDRSQWQKYKGFRMVPLFNYYAAAARYPWRL